MSAGEGLLDAAAACALLGVKPASLYAYVSRGQIRSLRVGQQRQRWYVAEDVRRLAARAGARRGHEAVAVGALRWGEPVLASAITAVADGALAYRGHRVGDLLARGARFEQVAELLWEAAPAAWPTLAPSSRRASAPSPTPVALLIATLPHLRAADPAPWPTTIAREHARARALIVDLLGVVGAAAAPGGGLAAGLARGLGRGDDAARALDAALVACADHELNPSTFAARVAAGTGADLYACVGAALYTLTGPRHGGAPEVVDAVLDELPARGLPAAMRARLARGERLPGFGHRLYPAGDPRVPLLTARLPRPVTPAAARRLAHARAVAELGHALTGEAPSLDYALVMIARALDLPATWTTALFALGRVAGWVAHALEQRASGDGLRPRARYVGPPVITP
ncbi:MAG: citrate synthase [Myxococcales bacterium]|nr:citrate synthase [Myxococcales bacterium]